MQEIGWVHAGLSGFRTEYISILGQGRLHGSALTAAHFWAGSKQNALAPPLGTLRLSKVPSRGEGWAVMGHHLRNHLPGYRSGGTPKIKIKINSTAAYRPGELFSAGPFQSVA